MTTPTKDTPTTQCRYVYPVNSRERGRQCEKTVRDSGKANWTGLCSKHVSCGASKDGRVTHISLESEMRIWRREMP